MCEILEEEIKEGNSKKAQEKEWSRYFDYDKDKQKYIILKIYNEILEKNDLRVIGNNSIYNEHGKLILLKNLEIQEGNCIELTLKQMYLLFGMINENYIKMDHKKIKEIDEYINDYYINDFDFRSNKKFREIIYSTLKNLKNQFLIVYHEITMININELINNKFYKNHIREATIEEENKIKDIKNEVLKKMGFDTVVMIYLKGKKKEFFSEVNQLLYERYDINYSWETIRIIFTNKYISEAVKEIDIKIEKQRLEEEKQKMNEKVIDAINKQAENKYKKKLEENKEKCFGEPNQMKLYDNKNYVYAQKKIAEYLLTRQ
jgi:hypothetical protein